MKLNPFDVKLLNDQVSKQQFVIFVLVFILSYVCPCPGLCPGPWLCLCSCSQLLTPQVSLDWTIKKRLQLFCPLVLISFESVMVSFGAQVNSQPITPHPIHRKTRQCKSMNIQELKAESKRIASVLTVTKVSKSQVSLAFVKYCRLFLSTSIYITQRDYLTTCIVFSACSSLSSSLLSCLLWHWFLSFIILSLPSTGLEDKNCSCSFSCYLKIRARVLNVLVFLLYFYPNHG